MRREVKRLAFSIPRKRYVQELINGELHVGTKIPAISEISHGAPIEGVVDARDIDGYSCQWNFEIGRCDGLSARLKLARDADDNFVELCRTSGGNCLQLNRVFSVRKQCCIERAECQRTRTCRIRIQHRYLRRIGAWEKF